MYAKVFTSIYQGTLRGNAAGILVFTNLLAHCDRTGVVDIHPRAIADEVGVSLEQVREALRFLEAPDRESRSPDEDGRRIVRLDDHRDWGWRVVNYAKYRAIRNEEDRAEQNRAAQAKWRDKQKGVSQDKPTSAVVSRECAESAHAEAEAEVKKDISTPTVSHPRKRGSAGDDGFKRFWLEYPRKTAKVAALKAFVKLSPSSDLLDEMLQALAKQSGCRQWLDGVIPHPATWINGKRWEDEEVPVAALPAALTVPGFAAAEQTAALLAEQAEAGRRAQSPEAQEARRAAMARVKGVWQREH